MLPQKESNTSEITFASTKAIEEYQKTECWKRHCNLLKQTQKSPMDAQRFFAFDAVESICIGLRDDFSKDDFKMFSQLTLYNAFEAGEIAAMMEAIENCRPEINKICMDFLHDHSGRKEFP